MAARRGSASDKKSDKNRAVSTTPTSMSDKNFECSVCELIVEHEQKGIECEICKSWYHIGCVNINDKEYEVLSDHKIGTIHWYCTDCNVRSVELLRLVFGLQDRIQKNEREMDTMRLETNAKISKIESEYEAVREDLKNLNKRIEEDIKKCSENIRKEMEHKINKEEMVRALNEQKGDVKEQVVSFRDVVKEQLEQEMLTKVDDTLKREFMVHMNDELGDFQRTINETKQHVDDIREQEDIEARRCNVILYRVPESSGILSEDRRKEDTVFSQQFFNDFNVGFVQEDIKNVYRLGARHTDQEGGIRSRPLLVQMANRQIKNLIMESLYKIKSLATKFKSVVVAHDMTKKQRLECKDLVAQAKQRSEEESGDFFYRVRGPPGNMRIVPVRKRQ